MNLRKIEYGVSFDIGKRYTMEDKYTIMEKNDLKIFAIYDGHGGDMVSNYLAKNFATFIFDNWKTEINIIENLKTLFVEFDKQLYENEYLEKNGSMCGSTAVVVIVTPKDIWIANVGDSEAIAILGDSIIPLTFVHNTSKHLDDLTVFSFTY